MATTTNYGWTTPDDTDLVKNGADAIRDLGSAIDTSMNTALGTKKAGLVLLNTTSFSAVASQSINDVFSATYTNYAILVDYTTSGSVISSIRMRASGTDNTTANYQRQLLEATATTLAGERSTNQTSAAIAYQPASRVQGEIKIFKPFLAANTTWTSVMGLQSDTTSVRWSLITGGHTVASSFTGFTIFPTSGTMTGTFSVYAYSD